MKKTTKLVSTSLIAALALLSSVHTAIMLVPLPLRIKFHLLT